MIINLGKVEGPSPRRRDPSPQRRSMPRHGMSTPRRGFEEDFSHPRVRRGEATVHSAENCCLFSILFFCCFEDSSIRQDEDPYVYERVHSCL